MSGTWDATTQTGYDGDTYYVNGVEAEPPDGRVKEPRGLAPDLLKLLKDMRADADIAFGGPLDAKRGAALDRLWGRVGYVVDERDGVKPGDKFRRKAAKDVLFDLYKQTALARVARRKGKSDE